jgi:hypothetical protein
MNEYGQRDSARRLQPCRADGSTGDIAANNREGKC